MLAAMKDQQTDVSETLVFTEATSSVGCGRLCVLGACQHVEPPPQLLMSSHFVQRRMQIIAQAGVPAEC